MKEAIDIVEEINASIHFVRDTMLIISFTPKKIVLPSLQTTKKILIIYFVSRVIVITTMELCT
jgi:hypothetical protein